jgi:succinate dehydrogenase / fumarate reductase cytochrome b subunit
MATAAHPAPSTSQRGVKPLRAGQGHSFLLRKLHSLSGIIPIGAFLIEHFLSNAEAIKGPAAYAAQVKFLNSLPWVPFLEWTFIFLPILYHALYGLYIWSRGQSNTVVYPWAGNWLYTAQRWTGGIAFVYIAQHVYTMRFAGVRLADHPAASFAKVQHELSNPWMFAFYILGIIAVSWHFSYGIWLFAAKWGITPGTRARKRFGYVTTALAVVLMAIGIASAVAFVGPWYRNAPADLTTTQQSMNSAAPSAATTAAAAAK